MSEPVRAQFVVKKAIEMQSQEIAQYEYWGTRVSSDRITCSAGAYSDLSSPEWFTRDKTLLVVFAGLPPDAHSRLAIRTGFQFLALHHNAELNFGEEKFALAAKENVAVPAFLATQDRLVQLLHTRSEVTLKATTAKGVDIEDTFYLKGFSQALDRAMRECGLLPLSVVESAIETATSSLSKPGPVPLLIFVLILGVFTYFYVVVLSEKKPINVPTSADQSSSAAVDSVATSSAIPNASKNESRPIMGSLGELVGAIVKSPVSPEPKSQRPTERPQTQPFSDSGPIEGMALRIKRGERSGVFGKVIFTLDARMEASAEVRGRIEKYGLGKRIIYESANREKYRERARQHAENTRDQPGLFSSPGAQAWGFAKTLGRVGAAAINATASALSLRVTVNSLIAGVHVECKDMGELLEAEEAIKDAGLNLKAELEAATTFTGQEQVIDL